MTEKVDGSSRTSSPRAMGSWVSVVQKKQVLKKFDINVKDTEGQKSVEIPDEVFENATPLWEDFLVGKFLDIAPHVAKVHVILNKIWKQGTEYGRIDVYVVNSTTLRFKVSDPMIRSRILKRGMWNIAEVPMVVSKWSPIIEKDQVEEKSIPLWVHLKKVPMNMFSWEGLSFITSAVGQPVRLSPETAACSNFDVAKVFVNADLSKELPRKICFSKNGTDFWVDFIYPWLPPRCSICDKWGHLEARCVANMKDAASFDQEKAEESAKENKNKISDSDDGVAIGSSQETEQVEEKNDSDLGDEMIAEKEENTDAVGKEVRTENEESKTEDSEQWTKISSTKAGRSPNKNPITQKANNPISSASKYAVLSADEEEEGEIVNRVQTMEEGICLVKEKTEHEKVQHNEKRTETEVVVKEKSYARNTKKKQRETSATSTHVTKDSIPVTSNKRSNRRNN